MRIRDSFLYQHMVESLRYEPDWTPEMYCAYNDVSDETTREMIDAYEKDCAKDPSIRVPHKVLRGEE